MKKIILILIILASVMDGCRYDDGPLISFRSVEKRIEGTWKVIGFTSDSVDSLQYYNDSCGSAMRIYNVYDNTYDYINFDSGIKKFGGEFTFADNKKIMNVWFAVPIPPFKGIGPLGGGKSSDWKILKLEMKELKISTDFNGRNYIISFKKE